MISKHFILELDFKTYTEFYDYVIQSEVTGQQRQVRRYFKKMSLVQLGEFLEHLLNADISQENKNNLLTLISQYLKSTMKD